MRTLQVLVGFCTLAMLAMSSPVRGQVSDVGIKSPDNELTSVTKPYLYKSDVGHFQVMMPSGCAKVHRRVNGGDNEPNQAQAGEITIVSCDRFEKKGQGCSVTAFLSLTDGNQGDPGPPQVLEQVRGYLKKFGAQVQHQAEVSREFADGQKIEGIDVKAAVPGGVGELWVRGLLSGSDIFILAAWNQAGGLWNDPMYQTFFNSFAPSSE